MILNKQIHVKEEYFHEFCETRSEGVNGIILRGFRGNEPYLCWDQGKK